MKFDLHNTHERRPLKFKISVTHDDSRPPQQIAGEYFQERYILKMETSVEFWSNKAQLDFKREHALKLAYAHTFKDMLPLVEEILMNADDAVALATAGKLRMMMLGEDR